MEAQPVVPFSREILIFLIATGVVVPLFHRLRLNPVLGYLIAGVLIGPFGLGLWVQHAQFLSFAVITDLESAQELGAIGIVFLLFMIGLELSLERLWAMRRFVFGLGSLQIAATAAMIGFFAHAFGNSGPASIVIGACLALSSTAVVMQLLMQKHRLGTALGRISLAILLAQDLAVVPILFMVGMLGAKLPIDPGVSLLIAFFKAVLVIVFIYGAGRLVIRPLLRHVALTGNREMFMAAVLLAVTGISTMTAAAGLSMALGAFLAGLLFAETEYRHQVEVDIEPFKGLMLGLFFMSVGMGIDVRIIAANPYVIFLSVAGLFILKSAVMTTLCKSFRLPRDVAVEAGLLLGQGGEFAFIVFGLAMKLHIISAPAGQFFLIVTGLSILVTPLVAIAAEHLAAALRARSAASAEQEGALGGQEGHIIIAGFGRVGRTLANILDAEEMPWVALDTDADAVTRARTLDLPVFFGNAARREILEKASIGRCRAVVVTLDAPLAAERIVQTIRRHMPFVPVYARARDAKHAARLLSHGATLALPETVEASLQLASCLLEGLGVDQDIIRRRVDSQRAQEAGAG